MLNHRLGLALAGGKSRRMGMDKAAIRAPSGASWLASTVNRLEPWCDSVYVSCGENVDALRARYACVTDIGPSQGPLTGIISAHAHTPQATWLVLAVDLPNLVSEALGRLVSMAAQGAVIARSSDGLEPLCGLYTAQLLEELKSHYDHGERSVRRALSQCATDFKTVQLDDVSLTNVNTPDALG